MRPSAIRRRVLDDHQLLRAMALSLEQLAVEVSGGNRALLGPLRLEGETLLARLEEHMYWEDRYLRPALLASEAWGAQRARRLDDDHREQRELLRYALERVQDRGRPAVVVATNLLDLVKLLREDMDEEERLLLDERILRDDGAASETERR